MLPRRFAAFQTPVVTRLTILATACLVGISLCMSGHASAPPAPASPPINLAIHIDASRVVRKIDHRLFGGTNVAAWIDRPTFDSPLLRRWLGEMRPGLIRIPGGSWSDAMYWNGHGVRRADGSIDPAKLTADGYPDVDYSAYAPSFMVELDKERKAWAPRKDGWHGHVDVKFLHEFVRAIPGAGAVVCVNAGTGRPADAAEWVRWAKQMGYGVKYWEIGNELDGSWELGHFLRDGSGVLTPEMYAARFAEFAKAMKAADPTIKIGGAASGVADGGFCEAMLRLAGEHVDFVSIHTYPGSPTLSDQEQFAKAQHPREAVTKVRGWIEKYQPARARQIQIGYSEWNVLDPAARQCSDLFSALWSSLFMKELVDSGADFATQWDAFTHDEKSGHALFITRPNPARRSQYHGLWLWNNFAGDEVLASTREGSDLVHSLVMRQNDGSTVIMLVNTDRDRDATVGVQLDGAEPGSAGEMAVLSSREYFWNDLERRVDWSELPRVYGARVGKKFDVTIPPFSVVYVRVPRAGGEPFGEVGQTRRVPTQVEPVTPEARLVLPTEAYAGDRIEGWVQVVHKGTNEPLLTPTGEATLSLGGAAKLDRATARVNESAGRFFLTAAEPGEVQVTARVDGAASPAVAKVRIKPSVPQPRVFWEFEPPGELTSQDGYESDWTIIADALARPGSRVARVDLKDVVPDEKNRAILRLARLPAADALDRANIRGVVFDARVSDGFRCDDPNAAVQVVMQAPGNWWMILGRVPLRDLEKWATHQVDITSETHAAAMSGAMNVWFVLESQKPVTGAVFIDRVGFKVR